MHEEQLKSLTINMKKSRAKVRQILRYERKSIMVVVPFFSRNDYFDFSNTWMYCKCVVSLINALLSLFNTAPLSCAVFSAES